MKTIKIIMRSTITSFLCVILSLTIAIHFVFTVVKTLNDSISNFIDAKKIYDIVINKDNNDIYEDNLVLEYITDYKKYIFSKNSYPTVREKELNDSELIMIKEVKDKLDLNYDTIIKIRKVTDVLENSSIYLLLSISLFVLILLEYIYNKNAIKTLYYIGLSGLISCIFLLVSSNICYNILQSDTSIYYKILLQCILEPIYYKRYIKLLIIYILISTSLIIQKPIITKIKLKLANK